MVCTPVTSKTLPCIILVLTLVLTSYCALASRNTASRGKIGVDYGLNGDNLLTPEQTVELLCSRGIKRVRIYEPRLDVIKAFANSGIDLMIGVPDEEVPKLATNFGEACNWVTKYVLPFPTSSISSILVGNEWLSNPSNDPSLLVPAMKNIYNALSTLQLLDINLSGIKVSTPHSFNVLSNSSFPPSIATFADRVVVVMRPLLEFLDNTGSFFMVNIFPYFTYLEDKGVKLEFALFEPTEAVMDPNTGLEYTNLFDLQLDAVYAAITSLLSSPPSPSPCACNSSEVKKASNERIHSEAVNRKSPSRPAKNKPNLYVGESGWSSGGGSSGTPPGGGNKHPQFWPSTSALSSTQTSFSFSNAHELNHPSSLQSTTLARSSTLPSTTLTSFSPSPLSSSLVSHDLSTHTMPSITSTHAYVTLAPASKVESGVTSSSSTQSLSTISATSSLTSTATSTSLAHASNSRTSSSSASISNMERTKAEEVEMARCECEVATVDNARTYNQNLIRHVLQAKGTPAHPNTPIQAYIFALFDEDLKQAGTEQHFGLFFPNGTAVYPINFCK